MNAPRFSIVALVIVVLAQTVAAQAVNYTPIGASYAPRFAVSWNDAGTALVIAQGQPTPDTDRLKLYNLVGSGASATLVQQSGYFSTLPTDAVDDVLWCGNFVASLSQSSPYLHVYENGLYLGAPTGFSPDGTGNLVFNEDCSRLALTAPGSARRVGVYNITSGVAPEGQPAPDVVPSADATTSISMSPDGAVVAFFVGTNLHLYDITGYRPVKLATPGLAVGTPRDVSYAPDGSHLVYDSGTALRWYTITGTGFGAGATYTESGNTVTFQAGAAMETLCWAPNDSSLIIHTTVTPFLKRVSWDGSTYTVETGTPTAPANYGMRRCEWSPNGSYFTLGGSTATIYHVDPAAADPDAPVNVAAVVSDCSIVLTWDPASGGAVPSSYQVYRSLTSGTQGALLATVSAPTETYTDTTPLGGTRYYYSVAGVALGLEGPVSAQANAQTPGQCDRTPIFGDDGAIYGGDKTALAAAWQIPELGLSIFYGLLFVLLFVMLGFGFSKSMLGAGVGAVAGVVFSTAFGFFPVWLVFFVIALGGGLFCLFRGRN